MMAHTGKLHAVVRGDGPPILFLHGFLGSGDDFLRTGGVGDILSDSFRCLAVDLPGHGKSLFNDPDAYSFDATAQAVLGVLNECNIDTCTLYGYSMGGRLGYYLLARHSDRFTRAFLESTSPGLTTDRERDARRLADDRWRSLLQAGDMASFLTEWYAQPLFADLASDPARLADLIARRRKNDPRSLALSLEHLGTGVMPNLWTELGRLSLPIHLLVGERDSKFCGIADRVTAICRTADLSAFADAGHNVHDAQPTLVAETIIRYLKS